MKPRLILPGETKETYIEPSDKKSFSKTELQEIIGSKNIYVFIPPAFLQYAFVFGEEGDYNNAATTRLNMYTLGWFKVYGKVLFCKSNSIEYWD